MSVNLTPIILKEETSYTAQHQPFKQAEKTEPNTKQKTTKTAQTKQKALRRADSELRWEHFAALQPALGHR